MTKTGILPVKSVLFAAVALLLLNTSVSAATATITFVSPRGGEVYAPGQTQQVVLDPKTKAKSVTIELSRDGGTTFEALGTIDNSVKDTTKRNILAFVVAAPLSSNCVIRASGLVGKTQVTVVSSPFAIATVGTGSVTTASIADGSVTAAKIADASVATATLADGSVTTPKLANGAVTAAKMSAISASPNDVPLADGNGGVAYGPIPAGALPTTVTLQGNTFNAASKLVQLDAGAKLPAVDGSALTALNGTNIASGTVADARLSANIPLKNAATSTFTGTIIQAGTRIGGVEFFAQASAPTTRQDGTALADGDVWYETTSGIEWFRFTDGITKRWLSKQIFAVAYGDQSAFVAVDSYRMFPAGITGGNDAFVLDLSVTAYVGTNNNSNTTSDYLTFQADYRDGGSPTLLGGAISTANDGNAWTPHTLAINTYAPIVATTTDFRVIVGATGTPGSAYATWVLRYRLVKK